MHVDDAFFYFSDSKKNIVTAIFRTDILDPKHCIVFYKDKVLLELFLLSNKELFSISNYFLLNAAQSLSVAKRDERN